MRRWKNWRNDRLIERFSRCEFVEIRDKTGIPEQLLRSLRAGIVIGVTRLAT